jgi:hypothetical protein
MKRLRPLDSDRRRMSLRNRRALKITAKTVEEALAGATDGHLGSTARIQYVDQKHDKPGPVSHQKRSKVPPVRPEGTPAFERGYKMSQGGLPTLGRRR